MTSRRVPCAALLLALLVVALGCKSERLEPIHCPFYWTATRDGKTTQLLGTVHGGIAASQLPAQIWRDLEAARTVVVEADVEEPPPQSLLLRSGGTLREELGDRYWDKLVDLVGRAIAHELDRMKTLVAISVITLKLMPRDVTAIDAVVLRRARSAKKNVVFLETIQQQVDIFERVVGVRELKLVLDDPERARLEVLQLLAAYTAGDEARMLRVFDEQRGHALAQGYTEAELDRTRAETLDRRNEAWIPQIEALHDGGGAFIAVGAAHLMGPRSVNELLAKKGFALARQPCVQPSGK